LALAFGCQIEQRSQNVSASALERIQIGVNQDNFRTQQQQNFRNSGVFGGAADDTFFGGGGQFQFVQVVNGGRPGLKGDQSVKHRHRATQHRRGIGQPGVLHIPRQVERVTKVRFSLARRSSVCTLAASTSPTPLNHFVTWDAQSVG